VSGESVIAAIRRLNRAHPRLNRKKLLVPVGALLQAHMMDGRSAQETVAELEMLYRRAADKG
jgi:hypothetical protein